MKSKGFTLIELLVVIGVSTIFLLAVSGLSYSLLSSGKKADIGQELTFETSTALRLLDDGISQSMGVDPASSLSIDLAHTPASEVRFTMSTPSDNPLRINVTNGVLYLQKGVAQSIPLTPQGTQVTFLKIDADTATPGAYKNVRISLETTRNTAFGTAPTIIRLVTSVTAKDYGP